MAAGVESEGVGRESSDPRHRRRRRRPRRGGARPRSTRPFDRGLPSHGCRTSTGCARAVAIAQRSDGWVSSGFLSQTVPEMSGTTQNRQNRRGVSFQPLPRRTEPPSKRVSAGQSSISSGLTRQSDLPPSEDSRRSPVHSVRFAACTHYSTQTLARRSTLPLQPRHLRRQRRRRLRS